VEACCLLYQYEVMVGDKGWQALKQTERQVFVLLARSSIGKVTVHKNRVSGTQSPSHWPPFKYIFFSKSYAVRIRFEISENRC